MTAPRKRYLFIGPQTLYHKSTLPVALRAAELGHEVAFAATAKPLMRPFRKFSRQYVREHSLNVGRTDMHALAFIAKIAGLDREWARFRGNIRLVWRPALGDYDAIFASSKAEKALRRAQSDSGRPTIAVGYQHLPVVAALGARLDNSFTDSGDPDVFFGDNPYAKHHNFLESMRGFEVRMCCFAHLDSVYKFRSALVHPTGESKRKVLIFHPGGYRSVVSEPGDNKEASYAKQNLFIERVCLPLLAAGLTPVIKVHPLSAKYHDLPDLQLLVGKVERRYGLPGNSIHLIGPEEYYWGAAFDSVFILTVGSSSIHELWSAGLDNVFVLNYADNWRLSRYNMFDEIFIDGMDAYASFVSTKKWESTILSDFTRRVFNSYACLFDGRAVDRILSFADRCNPHA